MNAYDYAMKLEKEGEDFYRQLAKEADQPGLSKIFTMMADEEVKHYKMFEKLAKKSILLKYQIWKFLKKQKKYLLR